MLNNVTLMGRLTAEPQLRYTTSQIPVCSFTLACDADYKKDEVLFQEVVAWRNTAEFVSKYFHKGQLCVVHGRLENKRWEAQDGSKREKTQVVAEHVYFGGDKKQSNPGGFVEVDEPEGADGDLPF